MKSTATTVEQYLASLPDARRSAVSAVRRVILDNLDSGLQERMQYGVIGYCVPHSIWPHGHHTRPELPLMYMGLSSQKNDMVVYMLFLVHNERERAWFDKAWTAAGKRSHLDVRGMGCCLRFKAIEDLALDVIVRAMGRVPVKTYLRDHVAMLERIGKGPGGKVIKKTATGRTKTVKKKIRGSAKRARGGDSGSE